MIDYRKLIVEGPAVELADAARLLLDIELDPLPYRDECDRAYRDYQSRRGKGNTPDIGWNYRWSRGEFTPWSVNQWRDWLRQRAIAIGAYRPGCQPSPEDPQKKNSPRRTPVPLGISGAIPCGQRLREGAKRGPIEDRFDHGLHETRGPGGRPAGEGVVVGRR